MSATTQAEQALTEDGVQAVLDDRVDLPGHHHRRARTKSRISLQHIYRSLIVRGEASVEDLLVHFRPATGGDHDANWGRYSRTMRYEWWSDVAAPALRSLPGAHAVDGDGAGRFDTWRFEGVPFDPDEFDESHLVPLEDFRADAETHAEASLDEQGIPRSSSEGRRDWILSAWRTIRSEGEIDAEDLAKSDSLRRTSLEEIRDILLELPGIRRERVDPDPADLEVETMADVLEHRETLDEAPIVRWESTETEG